MKPTPEDEHLTQIVTAYTDDAPTPPTANDIINRRAERLVGDREAFGKRSLLLPILGGAALVIGAFVVTAQRGNDSIIGDTPATSETSEPDTSAPDTTGPITTTVTTTADSTANDSTTNDSTTNDSTDDNPADDNTAATRPVLPDGRPATFWAITTDDDKLVEVDTLTGAVIGTYGGWDDGAERDGAERDGAQRIDGVETGAYGRLWVTSCCEPAVGQIIKLESGGSIVPGETRPTLGSSPSVSPSGRLVAVAGLTSVEVRRADGETGDSPVSVFRFPTSDGQPEPFLRPAGWIDDDTLIIEAVVETSTLWRLDISDPSDPLLSERSAGGLLPFVGTAVRSDGSVVAAAYASDSDDPAKSTVMGWVYDMTTGERTAEFDLPDDTRDIDYDSTGTYLIVTGTNGVVTWYGAGQSGVIGQGFLAVSW